MPTELALRPTDSGIGLVLGHPAKEAGAATEEQAFGGRKANWGDARDSSKR